MKISIHSDTYEYSIVMKDSAEWLSRGILILSWIGLTVYLILRSIYVDMTIDESASALLAIDSKSYLQIYQLLGVSANNHFLNTVLIKFFTSVFNADPFYIRLPNIIAYSIYAFYALRILELKTRNYLIIVPAFILLNFSPYMLDWFSTARGYGLSYGFMMGSTYYLMHYLNNKKIKYIHLFLTFGILAVSSVFSMLNFYLSLVIIHAIILLISVRKIPLKTMLMHFGLTFIYTVILAVIFAKPLMELTASGQLYFGGNQGFWHDTVLSVTRHFLYDSWQISPQAVAIIIVTIIVSACLMKLAAMVKSGELTSEEVLIPLLLLFCPPAISMIQHYLFGTLFLVQRVAYFEFILLTLALILILISFGSYNRIHKYTYITLFFLSIFMSLHFAKASNIDKTNDWRTNQHCREAMKILKEYSKKHGISPPVKVYTSNLQFYSMDYYNRYEPYNFLFETSMSDMIKNKGLYYIETDKILDDQKGSVEIIREFPLSSTVLLNYSPKENQKCSKSEIRNQR